MKSTDTKMCSLQKNVCEYLTLSFILSFEHAGMHMNGKKPKTKIEHACHNKLNQTNTVRFVVPIVMRNSKIEKKWIGQKPRELVYHYNGKLT